MKRVSGLGRIFLKSESPPQLYDWYEKHLGTRREPQAADSTEPGPKALTVWCIFPWTTKYFGVSKASFMVNYRVDNLDALLDDLKKSGIEIGPHRKDYDYGRFAWITDRDSNRLELWEPPKPKED
jgi:hypothetical protein